MRISFFVLSIFFILVISACNLPDASSGPSVNDQAATIIAMTLQAATTPTPQIILNTPTAISIVTKSGGPATLTVTDNTNCRSGPGTNYSKVTTIPAGTTVTIVARYVAGNFWIVTPADGTGNCWVQGDLGTVSGDTNVLPIATPVENVAGSLVAPAFLKGNGWNFFCYGNGQTDITLNWADKSDNEAGFRVLRNDNVVVELPANSTSYFETITLLSGQSVRYQIQVFNSNGTADSDLVTMTCP